MVDRSLCGARLVLSLALGALAYSANDASAAPPKQAADGTVKACSRNGHGCISAAVRRGQRGPEVRLPGGTWISCAGDCRDALVESTLDFWDKMLETAPETSG